MRDFFINGLEWVIHALVILAAAGITVLAFGVAMQGVDFGPALPRAEGIWHAGVVFVLGMLALLVVGGALYLLLGIYANTRRTADALELLIALRKG